MISAPVRVSPEWLDLREPADAAARSRELVALLRPQLRGPLVIHDLGGGSGSMGRWLAPQLPGPQHWVVHDRDEALLRLVEMPDGVTVETRVSDITRLTPHDLAGASLITASALLDLLTAAELARVRRACAGIPMLLALTVVGRVTLSPADPLDARFEAAFNAHQRRNGKLGPDAVAAIPGAIVRPSPWRLGAGHENLIDAWLDGWIAAACEQDPALPAHRERPLEVTVEHADVLVLP
jgi:hypothetical protein